MKKNRFAILTATAVLAAGLMLTGCGSSSDNAADNKTTTDNNQTASQDNNTSTGNEQVVHVTAKNFGWTLDKTEVKKGQPVKFIVTASEGMHGFTIDGTSIKDVHAMPGKEETATFTPDKAGDLMIHCTIMCGVGHADMKATLKVVD